MAYLTMLNEMMDQDLECAIAALTELGIRHLDLKTHVFGRSIEDLDAERRQQLAALLERTNTEVYCFSSVLGHQNVARVAEREFRQTLEQGVSNLLQTAAYVRPTVVRLLGCYFDNRQDWTDGNDYLERHAAWVYPVYREAIEQVAEAGLLVTLENEPNSIFSGPGETCGFFERLDLGEKARFTWDIQNMWESGVYPTLDVYHELRNITNYVHLKGGRSVSATPQIMRYRSPLDEASWPVTEIVSQVLADGISPVLCLNASHGSPPPDYSLGSLWDTAELVPAEARRDVAFLRRTFSEIS